MVSPSFIHLPQAFNKTVSCIHICTETKPGEFMGQKRATCQQIMAVFHNYRQQGWWWQHIDSFIVVCCGKLLIIKGYWLLISRSSVRSRDGQPFKTMGYSLCCSPFFYFNGLFATLLPLVCRFGCLNSGPFLPLASTVASICPWFNAFFLSLCLYLPTNIE